MQKPAPVDFPIHEFLQNRWSPRALRPQSIPGPVLRSLFEAARWAPSSGNEQPWRFVVQPRERTADFESLLWALNPSNRRWAHRAGALVLCCARREFERNGKPNPHAWHDCGLALAQLLAETTARGLRGHPMAGFDAARARDACGVPPGYDTVTVVALGYPGDLDSLPADLRLRELAPRQRRPQAEFLFTGAWGRAWPPSGA